MPPSSSLEAGKNNRSALGKLIGIAVISLAIILFYSLANTPPSVYVLDPERGVIQYPARGEIRVVRLGASQETPSILGTIETRGAFSIWTPMFPLKTGEYQALYREQDPQTTAMEEETKFRFKISSKSALEREPLSVLFFPTSPTVPANHLKFYLVFNQPMAGGDEIWDQMSIRDLTAGELVPSPFRRTELWSQDRKTLTLWLHPGRQKTGVNLNEEVGPILEPNHEYELLLSRELRSEQGNHLRSQAAHRFQALEADHSIPDPKSWKIQVAQESIRLDFHEPLDWALIQSELQVLDQNHQRIPGEVILGESEMSWVFRSHGPPLTPVYLSVGKVLEDLAGNNIEKPFEVDRNSPPPLVLPEKILISLPLETTP